MCGYLVQPVWRRLQRLHHPLGRERIIGKGRGASSCLAVGSDLAARVAVDDDAVGRVEGLAAILARELAVGVGGGRLGLGRDSLACTRRCGET